MQDKHYTPVTSQTDLGEEHSIAVNVKSSQNASTLNPVKWIQIVFGKETSLCLIYITGKEGQCPIC